MKKIILTGTAILALAAACFAQNNTSTITQSGSQQSAEVMQKGKALISTIVQTSANNIANVGNVARTIQKSATSFSEKNQATINQLGTRYGSATIEQEGVGNLSTINQKNNNAGSGGDGNVVTTFQRGFNQQITVNQNDNSIANQVAMRQENTGAAQTATVNQTNGSTKNSATTNQVGNNNTLSISQSNNSDNNIATIRQGFPVNLGASAFNATAIVEQNGGALGSSSGNETTITQINRASNIARVFQNNFSGGIGELGNDVTISQSGVLGSIASVSQSNHSQNNSTVINQSVAGQHTAYINQDGDDIFSSYNNTVAVNQTGSGNKTDIRQLSADSNKNGQGDSYNNAANVSQSNSLNQAFIFQRDLSAFNTATVNQNGVSDIATITQSINSIANNATINQGAFSNGNNRASITQQQSAPDGGLGGNSATISQNLIAGGRDNIASIVQGILTSALNSNANLATINQEGSSNQARLQQTGDLNVATILQTGNGNIVRNADASLNSSALQLGTNNRLTIEQAAGSSGNIANVAQIGSDNIANILQNGSGNTITFSEIGNGHNISVAQTGIGNTVSISMIGN
ncbi:beta strand repeat-containing protein [Spirosoma fluviale]|uniref:Curlin associated repeat-containing protein n=1 Tax=Spirosoma fluviale TaxID=1597977 RepID=A0A286GJ01_9BACT|nr:RIP homotypic interaction motif-containing protein [Spirosoma fluviale]SOD95511.1 Curlin associated repeat-containing protein [Spirosoma fluviale]